jgi:FlaA1/EpsC-like NDP-sugar epimerase
VRSYLERLYQSSYRHRRRITLAIYAAIAAGAYALAFLFRFDFAWPAEYTAVFLVTLPVLVGIRIACHHLLRVSTERWRFVGTQDVVQLFFAVTSGTLLFWLAVALLPLQPAIPRSVIAMEWMLTVYLTAGLWLSYRLGFENLRHREAGFNGSAKRVIIVGAGEAGNRLAREMRSSPTGYRPIGFVDDDPAMWGSQVQRLEVIGSSRDLPRIAEECEAQEIVIAVPSAQPQRLRKIVERCEETGLPFKVLPGMAELLEGQATVTQLREVRIEDLLGRPPVTLELPELAEDLAGEAVLITGAAGSIGSELSRQVALHHPGKLVLLDQAETELYYLELELKERHPELEIYPVVGDIVDADGIEHLFERHRPSRVYHAAAYKHVPMMEANAREAVRNNVVGTWRVADAAGRHGAARFVLVSTDKAVRPANVMGATKRVAEMIVTELQDEHDETTYSAVRFGNVLGSNGSVIPIFRRQLKAGKALTVTHPDATRYFMTIPEAVQLILQASLLPAIRGQIAMLEMGEPVRIAELAKNLLRLSGADAVNGNGSGVVYTGLRPGEKLHEELTAPDEGSRATSVQKIRLVVPTQTVAPRICHSIRNDRSPSDTGRAVDSLANTLAGLFPNLQFNEAPPKRRQATGIGRTA